MSKTPKKTEETLVSCPTCGQDNFTPRGLKAHKCKGVKCPECGIAGFTVTTIKEHKCQTLAGPVPIEPSASAEPTDKDWNDGLEKLCYVDITGYPNYWLEIFRRTSDSHYLVGWHTAEGFFRPLPEGYGTLSIAIQSTLQHISEGFPEFMQKPFRKKFPKVLAEADDTISKLKEIERAWIKPEESIPIEAKLAAAREKIQSGYKEVDMSDASTSLAVVPATGTAEVVANAPSLTIFRNEEAASKVRQLVSDAQDGLRRILVCGLYLETIKHDLPHGQFRRWLEAYVPEVTPRTVATWMTLASNIREAAGIKWEAASHLQTPIYDAITLPPQDRPAELQEACAKMDELMAGKSARQLLLEFKQAEEDADGNLVARRGRLPGSKTTPRRKGIGEQLDEEAAESEEFLNTLKGDLYLAATGNGITKVDRDLLEALLANSVQLSTRIRELLKGH